MNRKTLFFLFSFFLILILGIFFRISNISPHKIYPDAYQSLLVAMNIADYHSVVGLLGNNGMLYPDFFAWSRPGFPLFILFTSLFTHDFALAAQIVSVTASILSLPLAFFLGRILYKSQLSGITTILLLAFSFNHTARSGFILTEGMSVFLMLLFVTLFFTRPLGRFSLPLSLLRGILFALLILTRYEYSLLIIPVLYYVKVSKSYTREEILTFLGGAFFTLLLAAFLLYPLPGTLFLFFHQTQDLLIKSVTGLGVLLALIFFLRFLPKKIAMLLTRRLPHIMLIALWFGTFYLLLQTILPLPLNNVTAGLRNFLLDDLVLSSSFLIGITLFIRRYIHRDLLTFSLLSIVMLYSVYFRTNPAMERYITHLIPFLLIPAGYGLAEVISMGSSSYRFAKTVIILMALALLFQGLTTWMGIHEWGDKSWFSISYDERAALLTSKRIVMRDSLLLASFPEPYYYVSSLSTHSITDTYPYVYIPDALNDKEIVISEDMGMRDIFPTFTSFLTTHMQDRRLDTFYVHLPYHYAAYSREETHPVTLYKTTVGELKERIQNSK